MSSQAGEEDKKPNTDPSAVLFLVARGLEDNSTLYFRMKSSTRLKNLMNIYCERLSVGIDNVRFLFNGRCLRAEQTPAELEMEDGDEIIAYFSQRGGMTEARFRLLQIGGMQYGDEIDAMLHQIGGAAAA